MTATRAGETVINAAEQMEHQILSIQERAGILMERFDFECIYRTIGAGITTL